MLPLAEARAQQGASWRSRRSSRSSSAAACSRTSTWRTLAQLHRLGPVLPDLGPGRPLPGDPDRRSRRRGGAQGVRGRPGDAEEDHRRPLADGERRRSRCCRRTASTTTTSRSIPTTSRSEVAFTWHGLRQQGVKPVVDGVQRPNQCLSDFIAPKSSGVADYIGMFAVTAGHRHREVREALRSRARRLLVDHAEGAGRPPGRSVRRVPARARAHRPVGLCGGRGR